MLLVEVFQSNYLYVSKWLSNLPDMHTLQFEGRNNLFFKLFFSHFKNSRTVTFCAIWYHFYNLKNVKITHDGV